MTTISRLCIAGYRSLRDVRLEVGPLTVVTGANGSGKSSLYRALHLLADIAHGRVIQSLAGEGGLDSALWAGPETISFGMRSGRQPIEGTRRKGPVSLKLGFSGDDYGYAMDLGLPTPPAEPFSRDPEIKTEALWTGLVLGRANVLAERNGPSVRIRDQNGVWQQASTNIRPYDSMVDECGNHLDGAELLALREQVRSWRFYDTLRTDKDAPARRRQVGTRTPVLANDGADLAAAIATIQDIGASDALDTAIEDAFSGGRVAVSSTDGYFEVEMHQHGLLRPLKTAELSDGTLRYLMLVAALLTPRPPPIMVLNEPETSLHPDLLLPLVRLIVRASQRSQIMVVTHAAGLVSALHDAGAHRVVLGKEMGETVALDAEAPAWRWPTR